MARAVMRLKKGVQLAFGPTIDGGFYYDFECEEPLTEDDFPAIEAEMQKIIELDEPFERIERPRADAIQVCKDLKQDFKVEHIETGLADDASLVLLPARRISRPLPRSARSFSQINRRLQVAFDRRCLLERRSVTTATAATLCDRVLYAERSGRTSGIAGRSQKARSSRAGKTAGAVPH